MKRARQSERDRKEDKDRLSDLPDCVLLHIMEFMNIKHAVQTCVLSKRWKDLWKRLNNLRLYFSSFYSSFRSVDLFDKFVYRILSCRDGSIPLHNLHLKRFGYIKPTLLNRVISLTYLELSIQTSISHSIWSDIIESVKLPKSLELPALKSLHLQYVTFSTSDNGCAEPFSTCNMSNTLVITCCYLQYDAKVLCISNSRLSSWLQVFTNVKIITLSSRSLEILNVLSTPGSFRTQPPCFVRLKSLKLKMKPYSNKSDEEVCRIVEYLLQNSLLARVDIINC